MMHASVVALALLGTLGAVDDSGLEDEPAWIPLRTMHTKGLLSDEEYRAAIRDLKATRAQRVAPVPTVALTPGLGMTVRTQDNRFAFNVRGRVQLRATLAASGVGPTGLEPAELAAPLWDGARKSSLDGQLRTARFIMAGHAVNPDLKYTLQLAVGALDFEPGNPSPVFDAWVEYTRFRDANVRVGQFFVPLDRARTIREFSLQFVDRQLPIQELNLDRDVGVELSSKDLLGLNGRVAYALFVGTGDGRNSLVPTSPGLLTVARVSVRPMGAFDDDSEGDLERRRSPKLALGLGAGFNQHALRPRSTLGTRYALPKGFHYTHMAADLVFKWMGLSLLVEGLVRVADAHKRTGVVAERNVVEWSRSGAGLVVQGGLMLTDQLEVVARYDRLWALGATDPALRRVANEQGHEVGAGANLYLFGHRMKFQADVQHRFGTGVWDRGASLARVQTDISF